MGEVWTARRSALGGAAKFVAIKTLLPSKASDPKARKMFLDEARLSMLLTNSNIVQVFDVDESSEGTCYMAMELVEGINLAKLIAYLESTGESLSHSLIAYVTGEVLKALAYAHEFSFEGKRRTIVHRDISPHNVMLSVFGEVKLMDFGVARLAEEDTSGLFVKGKIRYMPPEQIRGESRHPTVDLFAVGAILQELFEGKKFRGEARDETRLLCMCVNGDVPPLTRPGIPAVFERLRLGLLAPDVADRIPNARAAHRCLSQWAGDRDARFELEEVIRRLVTNAAKRSGTSNSRTAFNAKPEVTSIEDLSPGLNDALTVNLREGVPSELTTEFKSPGSFRLIPEPALADESTAIEPPLVDFPFDAAFVNPVQYDPPVATRASSRRLLFFGPAVIVLAAIAFVVYRYGVGDNATPQDGDQRATAELVARRDVDEATAPPELADTPPSVIAVPSVVDVDTPQILPAKASPPELRVEPEDLVAVGAPPRDAATRANRSTPRPPPAGDHEAKPAKPSVFAPVAGEAAGESEGEGEGENKFLPTAPPQDEADCTLEPDRPDCGVPETPGAAALKSGFDAVAAKARTCGSKYAAMIGSKVEIRVSINGSTGKVTHVETTGTYADTPLGKCVEEVVSDASFGVFRRSEYTTSHTMAM